MRHSHTKKLLLAAICFLMLTKFDIIHAQVESDSTLLKEVVITGTRITIPVEKSGKSIYKFKKEDLQRNAGKSIVDLLNEVPGIQTDGNFGAPGTNIGYFIRGGRNSQTLVLIDGVPLNDPSGITLEYDLRNLPLDQIESVEVLKGGLSTLYGSGAAAGVINIILSDAGKEAFYGSVKVGGGSFGTLSQGIELGGTTNGFKYLISAQNENSSGFSAALDRENEGFDDDGISRQNGLLKLGYQFNNRFSIDFQSAYDRFKSDFDDGAFTDGDNDQETKQFRVGIRPKYTYNNGELVLNLVYNQIERDFKNAFGELFYEANNLQVDLSNQYNIGSNLKAFFGVNLQRLSNKQTATSFQDADFSIIDPYASLIFDHDNGLNIHAGVRINTHSEYGSKFIYNINPSYLIDLNNVNQIKVFGSIATSFIAPSLFQTYSSFGNLELNPEEVINYEGGLSFYLGQNIKLNTVYFYRDETDPIGFVSFFDDDGAFIGGEYQNVTDTRSVKGFEFDGEWIIKKSITLGANYTYAESDVETSFYRIPKHKFGASLQLNPFKDFEAGIKYNYTAERTVFDFATFSTLELESFGLIDLYASYALLNSKLKLFGGVNNVLDKDFVAIQGFTTRGINFSVGASYKF